MPRRVPRSHHPVLAGRSLDDLIHLWRSSPALLSAARGIWGGEVLSRKAKKPANMPAGRTKFVPLPTSSFTAVAAYDQSLRDAARCDFCCPLARLTKPTTLIIGRMWSGPMLCDQGLCPHGNW